MSGERLVINGETCELVTDFASLRCMDTVYAQKCDDCGGTHRGVLFSFDPAFPVYTNAGQRYTAPGWVLEPNPRCGRRPFATLAVIDKDVGEGTLWRVVDEEITKVTKVRERVVSR